jgi:CubicO group peptidase (beta-lactamase class C family)
MLMNLLFATSILGLGLPNTHPRPTSPDFNSQLDGVDKPFQSAVEKRVQAIVQTSRAVGATVAVVIDGRLVAAVAVGLRKFGSPEPLLVTDPMHVGSNTKGMTALLFGRLVEKGRLGFNETVEEAFPYATSPEYATLPLIEFLYQRSGFTDASVPDVFDRRYFPKDPQGLQGTPALFSQVRQTFAKDCLSRHPGCPPASKHLYCNQNYVVVGAAEEVATHRTPWEDLMRREVFEPLHMRAAGFGPMGSGEDVSTPWQHIKKDGGWSPIYHDNPRYFGPAGTVHCSALDLANYAYARVLGAHGRTEYLSPLTWNTLQTPPDKESYACGIVTGPPGDDGMRDMSHEGNNNLSRSEWRVRNHGRIVVVAMMNCPSPALEDLMDTVSNLSSQYCAKQPPPTNW